MHRNRCHGFRKRQHFERHLAHDTQGAPTACQKFYQIIARHVFHNATTVFYDIPCPIDKADTQQEIACSTRLDPSWSAGIGGKHTADCALAVLSQNRPHKAGFKRKLLVLCSQGSLDIRQRRAGLGNHGQGTWFIINDPRQTSRGQMCAVCGPHASGAPA